MAKIEIDETDLVNYQQLAGAMQKMLANPEARRKLLEAQKKVNPDAVIPELDATKPLDEALSNIKKDVDETRKMLADDKADREKEKTLSALRSRWENGRLVARKSGYTAEGLESLEKFMEDKGIADHEIAMPAFEKLHPPEAPIADSGSNFDMLRAIPKSGDDMKMLFEGNDQEFLAKKIKETLTDIRSGSR